MLWVCPDSCILVWSWLLSMAVVRYNFLLLNSGVLVWACHVAELSDREELTLCFLICTQEYPNMEFVEPWNCKCPLNSTIIFKDIKQMECSQVTPDPITSLHPRHGLEVAINTEIMLVVKWWNCELTQLLVWMSPSTRVKEFRYLDWPQFMWCQDWMNVTFTSASVNVRDMLAIRFSMAKDHERARPRIQVEIWIPRELKAETS